MALHYCPQCLELISKRKEEALKVLQTSIDFNEIQLVLSLFPFGDLNTCVEILSNRRLPFHALPANWSDNTKNHKTDEILRRIALTSPNAPIWNAQRSTPVNTPVQTEAMTTARIACGIDKQISEEFCRVTFRDLVSEACGYETDTVRELLRVAKNSLYEVRHQIHEQYELRYQCKLAEKEVENPLARWVLHHGIMDTDEFPDPADALASIYVPIQDLFMNQNLPLIPMLRHLAILSTIHQNCILSGEDVQWESLRTADFWFWEHITSQPPSKVAALLTDTDYALFRKFCADDFLSTEKESSERLSQMSARWNRLANAVKLCLATDLDLFEPICELAEKLLTAKNYYSGMALLHGLPHSICPPAILSSFWTLLITENNYANYRERWSTNPGLPFLFPHVYELRRTRDEREKGNSLSELFRFSAYPGYSEVTTAHVFGSVDSKTLVSHPSSGLWDLLMSSLRRWARLWNQGDQYRGNDIDLENSPLDI